MKLKKQSDKVIPVDIESFKDLENEFRELFKQLATIQGTIREKLINHADGKTLKGNELAGWVKFTGSMCLMVTW